LPHNAGMTDIRSPLQAQWVQCLVKPGDAVAAGQVLLVLEAMKMEHEVCAGVAGRVGEVFFTAGQAVAEGDLLLKIEQTIVISPGLLPHLPRLADLAGTTGLEALAQAAPPVAGPAPAPAVRADLQRLHDRQAFTHDAARAQAVAKRHALGLRTARENIAALCDAPGGQSGFMEYGALAVAAQARRRSADDLIANTPADGMVTGIGPINGHSAVVMAYDATVLAGTQGMRNHQKTDRLLGIALAQKLPVVLLAEGGGGRPGDTDMPIVAGLHVTTFASFARLNGQVPVVGIVAGRCFAGNAALLGCCDVIIATEGSNIGMGGPAMVEGGGLGQFTPEQIGPSAVQHANGVIDVLVADEAAAVLAARQYLSYFQNPLARAEPGGKTAPGAGHSDNANDNATGNAQSGAHAGVASTAQPDAQATSLRAVVPENRLRVYDSMAAVHGIADAGSVLVLRAGFGAGIHTALIRIGGRPAGIMANNPLHLGGAIDAAAADKAARFMQLCNAHGLPLVSLVDTPGFMVGPDVEATAQVRHVSRLFIAAAHLRVPFFSVVLRKGYGLGAMAMTAGGFHAPLLTVAWPTAEFGAMGLEGAVKLGYRKELAAAPEGAPRQALYDELLAQQYAAGSAINMAQTLEIDAVIDPADTRAWLLRGLAAAPALGQPLPAMAIDSW
jgi:acetyl-CoA carboxylase carboxyltransferase component